MGRMGAALGARASWVGGVWMAWWLGMCVYDVAKSSIHVIDPRDVFLSLPSSFFIPDSKDIFRLCFILQTAKYVLCRL